MRYLLIGLINLTFVQAFADESFRSYDQIVRELTAPSTSRTSSDELTRIDFIKIHAQLGAVASRVNLRLPNGLPSSQGLGGIELVTGIDLFSPVWIAEGAVRSYNTERFASSEISLKEFDLRVIHQPRVNSKFSLRMGGGLSARYLEFSKPFSEASDLPLKYTTPASVFILGAQTRFNHAVGLTAEIAYRSRIVSDTIDRNSLDGSIRVSGSF